MTKDEALKLALEALEEAADAIDSWGSYASGYFQVKHDLESDISKAKSAITAIKEALAQPEQEPVAWMCADESLINKGYARFSHVCMGDWKIPVYTTKPQRTWVGLTPACPSGLTQYECEVEGVDLVCFLEYTPDEEGSRDSYGLLNEPGTSENLELVNAYVKGTDVDIGHLLLQYLVDHITTTALEDFKNDDY
jgi:hypothetical protein